MGQEAKKIESAHDKCARDKDYRTSKNNQDNPDVKFWILELARAGAYADIPREPIVAQKDEDSCDDDKSDEPDQPIKKDSEKSSRFLVRSLFPEQISFDDIAASSTGKELIVEHADQEQSTDARSAQPRSKCRPPNNRRRQQTSTTRYRRIGHGQSDPSNLQRPSVTAGLG